MGEGSGAGKTKLSLKLTNWKGPLKGAPPSEGYDE